VCSLTYNNLTNDGEDMSGVLKLAKALPQTKIVELKCAATPSLPSRPLMPLDMAHSFDFQWIAVQPPDASARKRAPAFLYWSRHASESERFPSLLPSLPQNRKRQKKSTFLLCPVLARFRKQALCACLPSSAPPARKRQKARVRARVAA